MATDFRNRMPTCLGTGRTAAGTGRYEAKTVQVRNGGPNRDWESGINVGTMIQLRTGIVAPTRTRRPGWRLGAKMTLGRSRALMGEWAKYSDGCMCG